MRPLPSLFILPLVAFLAGCSGTPYQPVAPGSNSVGYSSGKMPHNRYFVTFSGNPRSDGNRVRDFALLRAAEITKEAGFTHFRIDDEDHRHGGMISTQTTQISTPMASDPTHRQKPTDFVMNGPGSRLILDDTQVKASLRVYLTITVGNIDNLQHGVIHSADEMIHILRKKYGIKPN